MVLYLLVFSAAWRACVPRRAVCAAVRSPTCLRTSASASTSYECVRTLSMSLCAQVAPRVSRGLRAAQGARQGHVRQGDPLPREADGQLLRDQDPQEGGHHPGSRSPALPSFPASLAPLGSHPHARRCCARRLSSLPSPRNPPVSSLLLSSHLLSISTRSAIGVEARAPPAACRSVNPANAHLLLLFALPLRSRARGAFSFSLSLPLPLPLPVPPRVAAQLNRPRPRAPAPSALGDSTSK